MDTAAGDTEGGEVTLTEATAEEATRKELDKAASQYSPPTPLLQAGLQGHVAFFIYNNLEDETTKL